MEAQVRRPSNSPKPPENVPPVDVTRDFCETTSAHGVSRLVNSQSKTRVALWSLLILGSIAGAIFLLTLTIGLFLEYRYTEVIKVVHQPQQLFPSISICNEMPFSVSKITPSQVSTFFTSLGFDSPDCDAELRTPRRLMPQDIRNRQADKARLMFEYNPNVTRLFGQPMREFLTYCSYQGADCNDVEDIDIRGYVDPSKYNCFTFNPPAEKMLQGKAGELRLILYVGDEEPDIGYNPFLGFINADLYLGVKIGIHRSDEHSYGSQVLHATVGQSTTILFRPKRINRLKSPYNASCTDRNSTVFPGYGMYAYTKELCTVTCFSERVYEKCGCVPSPLIADLFDPKTPFCGAHPCNYTRVLENTNCYEDIRHQFEAGLLQCDCPLPCDERRYEAAVHSSVWPSKYSLPSVAAHGKSRLPPDIALNDTAATMKFVRENFLEVIIRAENFEMDEVTQQESMDWYSFLSSVGGVLGFFVGFSVLTVCEVFELLARLACAKALKRNNGKVETLQNVKE